MGNQFKNTLLLLVHILLFFHITSCGSGGGSGQDDSTTDPNLPQTVNISIQPSVEITEGNSGSTVLEYTVTLSSATDNEVKVDFATGDISATAGIDYVNNSGSLTFAAGETSQNIAIEILAEQCFEDDEIFSVSLSNASSNAQIVSSTSEISILNDDARIQVSLSDAITNEGDTNTSVLSFAVDLDRPSCYDTSVNYSTSDVSAEQPTDYTQTSGFLLIPAGERTSIIDVAIIGDTTFESDETFSISLSNPSHHALLDSESAFGTILNDDLPNLVIIPAEIAEGDNQTSTMIFLVSVEESQQQVSFSYSTFDMTALVSDSDYLFTSGDIIIPAGETSAEIAVGIIGDNIHEPNEEFGLNINNIVGATYDVPNVIGTIINDDEDTTSQNPQLTIPPQSVVEGADGELKDMVFTVSLDQPITDDLKIAYEFIADSALPTTDYIASNGQIEIPAGELTATITVQIVGDDLIEANRKFFLVFERPPESIELLDKQVTARIIDDDFQVEPPIFLDVNNASIIEGDSGTQTLRFSVTLTEPFDDTITVDYLTVDKEALAIDDYFQTSGTLTLPSNTQLAYILVPIVGDTVVEADETFTLELTNLVSSGDVAVGDSSATGLIETDDPFTDLSISDAGSEEGNAGQSDLIFEVKLSTPSSQDVSVDYNVVDVTATASDDDYSPTSGTLVIPVGDIEAEIRIAIIGDTSNEQDEIFTVELSNISNNAHLHNSFAIGSIINDDNSVGWGIPQKIDPLGVGKGAGILPKIDATHEGHVIVSWYDTALAGGVGLLSTHYSPEQGWRSISNPSSDSANDFDVSISSSELSFAGWASGEASVNRYDNEAGWGLEHDLLEREIEHQDTRLVSDQAGNTFAIWNSKISNSPALFDLSYSLFDPILGTWSEAEKISEGRGGTPLEIALDKDGPSLRAIAVWPMNTVNDDGLLTGLHASFYDPSSKMWEPPQEVTDEFPGLPGEYLLGFNPQVDMDTNGNAMIVWNDTTGSGSLKNGRVLAKRYDQNTGWSNVIQLDHSFETSEYADVKFDQQGNAVVMWLERSASDDLYDIYARRYINVSNSWNPGLLQPPTLIADSNIELRTMPHGISDSEFDLPNLAVDTLGNAIISWSQDVNATGDRIIRASRFSIDDSTWSAPEPISTNLIGEDAGLVKVVINNSGDAIAVWEQEDSLTGNYQIWLNKYVAPILPTLTTSQPTGGPKQ